MIDFICALTLQNEFVNGFSKTPKHKIDSKRRIVKLLLAFRKVDKDSCFKLDQRRIIGMLASQWRPVAPVDLVRVQRKMERGEASIDCWVLNIITSSVTERLGLTQTKDNTTTPKHDNVLFENQPMTALFGLIEQHKLHIFFWRKFWRKMTCVTKIRNMTLYMELKLFLL